MANGLYIIPAGADAWASYIDQSHTALNDGWVLDQSGTDATGVFTTRIVNFATNISITLLGDQTTVYVPGRRLRIVHGGGTTYCEVLSSTYGAPNTVVTITNVTNGPTTFTNPPTSLAYAHNYAGLSGNAPQLWQVLNRTTTTVVASTASVTSDSTLYTFTVPAGIMGTSGILRLSMFGDFLNNSGGPISSVFKLIIGTSTVFAGSTTTASIPASANRRYWTATISIQNVASASAQRASGFHMLGDGNATPYTMVTGAAPMLSATAYGTAAEASTAAMTVSYLERMASTATTVDCQLRHAYLELCQ